MVETKSKRPTDSLADDHVKVIAQLNRLRDAGVKLTGSSETELEAAKNAIAGVAAFLDKELELHLKKEEDALFPPLEAVIGSQGGPTAVMRYEHEDLRAKNSELQGLITDFDDAEKTRNNTRQLQGTINHIYNVLTQHIHKEDYILFPMANDALDEIELERVAAKMRELDGHV